MKTPIAIIKTGSTYPAIQNRFGDFEDWFYQCDASAQWTTINVAAGETPPALSTFAGAIITGSPAMVSEQTDWSTQLKAWIREAVNVEFPLLAICYGHQILADAMGGTVNWHPKGRESGTVTITLSEAGKNDPLLGSLPATFTAQATHAQSVITCPPNAIELAHNSFEPHHGIRIGSCAWGLQFHPEFNREIMEAYLIYTKLNSDNQSPIALNAQANAMLIQRFITLAAKTTTD